MICTNCFLNSVNYEQCSFQPLKSESHEFRETSASALPTQEARGVLPHMAYTGMCRWIW